MLAGVDYARRALHIERLINVRFFTDLDDVSALSWRGRVFAGDDTDGFVDPGAPTVIWARADVASARRAYEVALHETRHVRQFLDGGLRDRHADELQARDFARRHLEKELLPMTYFPLEISRSGRYVAGEVVLPRPIEAAKRPALWTPVAAPGGKTTSRWTRTSERGRCWSSTRAVAITRWSPRWLSRAS